MVSTSVLRRVSGRIFSRYSLVVDQVNHNALLVQFFRGHPDVPLFDRREEMYAHIHQLVGSPFDYLEFGVHVGDSMRAWLALSRHSDSRFFGFDTFTGLPEAWDGKYQAGHFNLEGKRPTFDDTRVTLVQGLFQDTLDGFLASFQRRGRLIVHQDADLHSSTLYTLAKLDPVLKPGDIVIFDDFGHALHEFRAWNDYLAAFRRRAHPIAATNNWVVRVAFMVD